MESSAMITEFVGMTQDVASQIEARRTDPAETKNDILRRILNVGEPTELTTVSKHLDLGQGVRVTIGETLYLFLTQPKHADSRPDGMAEAHEEGLYINGSRVVASRGSMLAPAMHVFQRRLSHVNDKGNLISLSAYRQWHVRRGGQLVPLESLKDPTKRRTRSTRVSGIDLSKLDLDLEL